MSDRRETALIDRCETIHYKLQPFFIKQRYSLKNWLYLWAAERIAQRVRRWDCIFGDIDEKVI